MAVEVNSLLRAGRCFRCLNEVELLRKQAALLCLIQGGECNPQTLLGNAACFNCGTTRQIELAIAQLLCELLGEGPCNVAEVVNDTPCLNCASWKDLYIIQTQLLCEFWGGDCDDIADVENMFCCLKDKRSLRLVILQLICELVSNPPTPGTVSAGEDQNICIGSGPVQLFGSANGTTGWTWTTSGDGTFSDDTILNPTYTPGAGDIALGTVTLTITSSSPVSMDSMTITLFEAATVNAGPDQTIDFDETVQLAGSFGGSATSATWTTSGTGVFVDDTDLNTIYFPSDDDYEAETVTLTLTTNDPSGVCPAVSDSMVVTMPVCVGIECSAYWSLETTETTIGPISGGYLDLTGGGANMFATGFTIAGGPSVDGIIGEGTQFLGGEFNSWLEEESDSAGTRLADNEYSLNAWVNFDSFPAAPANMGIMDQLLIGTGNNWFWHFFWSLGILNLRYRKYRPDGLGFDDIGVVWTPFQTVGVWHMVTLVRRFVGPGVSDFEFELWVDANLEAGGPSTLEPRLIPGATTAIGVDRQAISVSGDPGIFPGIIDEVGIANETAWTEEQIVCLYNNGLARRPDNLLPTLPTPTFDPDDGVAPADVTVASRPDASLHYTTNSTDPHVGSPTVTNPIELTASTDLRAIAIKTGYVTSLVKRLIYTTSLGEDCVGYWNFDETTSPATFADSMPTRRTLTNSGVAWDSGVGANRWTRSESDVVFRANETSLQQSSAFEMLGWVRLASLPAAGVMNIAAKDAVGNREYRLLWYQSANRFEWVVLNTLGTTFFVDANTFGNAAIDTWYFVRCRINATHIGIQINNGTIDEAVWSGTLVATTTRFDVGRGEFAGSLNPWDGWIGPWAMWKRNLSAGEVTTLYNAGVRLFGPV